MVSAGEPPMLAAVLALPELASARPEVVVGHEALSHPVRTVRIGSLRDHPVTGALLLVRGAALPTGDALPSHLSDLVARGVAALVVQLEPRWPRPTAPLVRSCRRLRLPLVVLHAACGFDAVRQAFRTLALRGRARLLEEALDAHRLFDRLLLAGATDAEIVAAAARLAAAPVVLEDLLHRVLCLEAGGADPARLPDARADGWISTPVGPSDHSWGRLLLLTREPTGRQRLAIELGARALALLRLTRQPGGDPARGAHQSLLSDVIEQRWQSPSAVHARAARLGVPLEDRQLVVLALQVVAPVPARADGGTGPAGEEWLGAAGRAAEVPLLIGRVHGGRLVALLATPPDVTPVSALTRIGRHVQAAVAGETDGRALLGVSEPTCTLAGVRRACTEALEVVQAACECAEDKAFFSSADIRLRGVLHLLVDDPRLQAFAERTLGPLWDHDARYGTALVGCVQALVRHRTKSAAAAALGLSRQTFYERLAVVERLLAVDLDQPESLTMLHTALISWETAQRPDSLPSRARPDEHPVRRERGRGRQSPTSTTPPGSHPTSVGRSQEVTRRRTP